MVDPADAAPTGRRRPPVPVTALGERQTRRRDRFGFAVACGGGTAFGKPPGGRAGRLTGSRMEGVWGSSHADADLLEEMR
jgi:hypothetical protein